MDTKPDESFDVFTALGAMTVLVIILFLALIAAGGWTWFANLLVSTAPAWIQAAGSILGIGIALWMPFHIRKLEQKEKLKKDAARAATAVKGVQATLRLLNATARTGLRQTKAPPLQGGDWMSSFYQKVASQPLPSDEMIMILAEHDSELGAALAQAKVEFGQFLLVLNAAKGPKDGVFLAKQSDFLATILEALQSSLGIANERLERLQESLTKGKA